MPRLVVSLCHAAAFVALVGALAPVAARAQTAPLPADPFQTPLIGPPKRVTATDLPKNGERTAPVGFPQDAGPHDASTIEWWYWNSFLTTESGKKYAVVASFFRTGLTPQNKGHYLIFSLADLDVKTKTAYSYLDKNNRQLLQAYLPLTAMRNPDDPRPMQLLAALQKNQLPAPHRAFPGVADVTTGTRFRIAFDKNTLTQASDDARTWAATLAGDDFALNLTLAQPTRPAMLVGGEGKTGLNRPDDMFYASLTRMASSGTLTVKGKTEKVTGTGWLDRQWGGSWVVGDNGWDWFGVQLSDGADLIVYRVKDNKTGKILRAEATLVKADGTQTVDKAPTFATGGELWRDPVSKISYPRIFRVAMPGAGYNLTFTPAFDAQTIPVIGIGDAIWEGVVNVTGTGPDGKAVTGRGYRELVGYRVKPLALGKAK